MKSFNRCRSGAGAIALLALVFAVSVRAAEAPPAAGDPTVVEQAAPISAEAPFQWEGDATFEWANNLSGGVQKGATYESLLNLGADADTGALGLWSGGQFHLSGVVINSEQPSDYVGDVQGVSNIAAPNAGRIYEAWYRQAFGDSGVALQAGLIDLNAHFVVTDAASLLLNSSYGITPTITGNADTSVYPEPGYAAMLEKTGNGWAARLGVFQGDPTQRSHPFSTGRMVIGETQWQAGGGQYTVGAWQHRGHGADAVSRWGYYGIAQQPLLSPRLTGFLQLAATPGSDVAVPRYLGAGFDLAAPLPGRGDDHFVGGLARAYLQGTKPETSYELSYVAAITPRLTLQPDFQYITHPGGTLPAAWLTMVRLGVDLH